MQEKQCVSVTGLRRNRVFVEKGVRGYIIEKLVKEYTEGNRKKQYDENNEDREIEMVYA